MNEMTLKEMNDERVVYLYRPNGAGKSGEVAYLFGTDDTIVISLAENDAIGRDAYMVCNSVKRFVKENKLLLKATQATY